ARGRGRRQLRRGGAAAARDLELLAPGGRPRCGRQGVRPGVLGTRARARRPALLPARRPARHAGVEAITPLARGRPSREETMKITAVEAFQVAWAPDDKPEQRSGFVRVVTDAGLSGLGEVSPMLGGRASLGVIADELAPELVGKDPLDHAVLLDRLLHKC